ncbi:MAG: zinc-dependent alcohol dehydrogenase family protein [Burkholderiaceae bacterium]|nr:zinc-dependent alcohol dehydrogenase family protein [Burkholderiaceae bacterium]
MMRARAMLLQAAGQPLVERIVELGPPAPGELLLRVSHCGVCRTDLHIVDGELAHPKLPLVPGHEIVGRVAALGAGVTRFRVGDRVGVPWLGGTCGACGYCRGGQENLCDAPVFTGYTRDGGYAQYALAHADYCFPLPDAYDDAHAAPLLCAGLIGYRALRMAGAAPVLGIYGFGAAAHLIAQLAVWQGRTVFAFTRPGDAASQAFARALGCSWAGDSTQAPPTPLDAALIFAPVGALVPAALAATRKGGTVVRAGIHMSPIPQFEYALLWGERAIRSVANLTRADGEEFLPLAARAGVRTHVTVLPLSSANAAIAAARAGRVEGALVLDCA